MLDEERLSDFHKEIKHASHLDGLSMGPEDILELIRLARLGRWAEKHAIPALNAMHAVLINRNYEQHICLTSHPAQNGCLVYSEWKLKEIKEIALAALPKN